MPACSIDIVWGARGWQLTLALLFVVCSLTVDFSRGDSGDGSCPNGICANTSLCCSQYNYCGPSSAYCGSGCQSGPCLSGFAPAGTCGPNNTCAGGLCCSQYGYCGSTPAYCGCGCKSGPCSGCKSRLSSGAIAGIVIGPTVVALALVGAIFFVAWRRSRRNRKEGNILVQDLESKSFDNGSGKGSYDPYSRQMSLSESFPSTLSTPRKRLSGEMLHFATSGFSDELGRGAFGIVYKGKLEDGTEIAVKKLLDGRREAKDFEAEVKTLGSINHSNLVALLGFTLERNQLFLIYEFVAKGSLDKWIFAHEKADVDFVLPWEARVGIVKGTAKGLAYLHADLQGGKSIIHLDIKPQNILLDESWAPKIADFGLAKLLGSETTRQTLAAGGTMGYMAPEVYVGVASPKMDVYSFGMVLLEVVCGRESVFESASPDSLFLPAWAIRKIKLKEQLDVVDPLLQGQYDAGLATKLIRIALLCLQRDPDERPEMSNVLRMMDGIVAPQDLPLTLQSEFEMAEKLIRGRVTKDASIDFIEFSGDSWKHKKLKSAGATTDSRGLEGVANGARSI